MAASRADTPYFVFEGEVSAVPNGPIECRGCQAALEPLRRTGGYCKACVAARSAPPVPPTDRLRGHMTVLRSLYRQRLGHRERYAEVQCDCGVKRTLKWSTWMKHKPMSCNACRLRGVEARGFEAEHLR